MGRGIIHSQVELGKQQEPPPHSEIEAQHRNCIVEGLNSPSGIIMLIKK